MESRRRAENLICAFLDCDPSVDLEVRVNYKSSNHGEYCLSRRTTARVQEKLEKIESERTVSLLSFQATLSQDNVNYFTATSLNPQGQLCLQLNRPIALSESLLSVSRDGPNYGRTSSSRENKPVIFVNDGSILKDAATSKSARGPVDGGCDLKDTTKDISLEEGRCVLLMEFLSSIFRANDCVIHQYHHAPLNRIPSNLLRHLLSPCSTHDAPLPTQTPQTDEIMPDQFLSALISPTGGDDGVSRSLRVDGGKFVAEHKFLGKGSYDDNIREIQVSSAKGQLSLPTHLAYETWRISDGAMDDDHVICHVTPFHRSFLVQQAMVLNEMYCEAVKTTHSQSFILLCGGVDCGTGRGRGGGGSGGGGGGGGEGRRSGVITLCDFLRVRRKQITEVYTVKYGLRAVESKQLQNTISIVTEAVVKFDLLSHDHHSTVRVEVPPSGVNLAGEDRVKVGEAESAARFPGAFVLYNYARLASILTRYKKLCDEGTYPQLPPADQIDCSLLSDEVEWQLLFNYVMRYPSIVQESSIMRRRKDMEVRVEVQTKKVCLFLTTLSQLVSAYYSRVKILMSPEPHLIPLIHARLHLVSALKQVMFNGLSLMGIEPLNEL